MYLTYHAAESNGTWSTSPNAFIRPGTLNIRSRSTAANAPSACVRTAPTQAHNTVHWINIWGNNGRIFERAAEGVWYQSGRGSTAKLIPLITTQACGPITSFKRLITPANKPQGFGFAEFQDPDGALRAMTLLNNVELPALEDGCVNKKLLVSATFQLCFECGPIFPLCR